MMNEDSPLQKAHSFYRFIRSYSSAGQIHLASGTSIDCEFECGQTEGGDIIIICSRQAERFLKLFIKNTPILGFSARTSSGQLISATNVSVGPATVSSSANESFQSFYARDLTVDTASRLPLQTLRYYIVNFEFILPITWNFGEYIINVKKIDGYREAETEMEATKKAKITAEIDVRSKNGYISDISDVERLVKNVCNLLSLAKGCLVNWLYWDAYSSSDTLVKSYHLNAVISRYTNFYLILKRPPKDIQEFVLQVYARFQDIQNGDVWDFDDAIIHYANTLASGSFTELKSLNLVSLIEYLTGRFAEHEKINKVLEDASFSDDKKMVLRKESQIVDQSIFRRRPCQK